MYHFDGSKITPEQRDKLVTSTVNPFEKEIYDLGWDTIYIDIPDDRIRLTFGGYIVKEFSYFDYRIFISSIRVIRWAHLDGSQIFTLSEEKDIYGISPAQKFREFIGTPVKVEFENHLLTAKEARIFSSVMAELGRNMV